MRPENKTIRGLWIGNRLTNIQKLSIQSFIDNGHDYHLYTYGSVEGVPKKALQMSAEVIVPWEHRARFMNDANFSDYFRSSLTLDLGGWYCDTDIICLKPFDFEEPRVFVSEYQFGDELPLKTKPLVNGCVIKIPKHDPMTVEILKRIAQLDTLDCGWIDVGPAQYRWGVDQFNYRSYIQSPDVFDNLWPASLPAFVGFTGIWQVPFEARAIHLRTSYWKRGSALDPDGIYPSETWFERLKKKHGVENGN